MRRWSGSEITARSADIRFTYAVVAVASLQIGKAGRGDADDAVHFGRHNYKVTEEIAVADVEAVVAQCGDGRDAVRASEINRTLDELHETMRVLIGTAEETAEAHRGDIELVVPGVDQRLRERNEAKASDVGTR